MLLHPWTFPSNVYDVVDDNSYLRAMWTCGWFSFYLAISIIFLYRFFYENISKQEPKAAWCHQKTLRTHSSGRVTHMEGCYGSHPRTKVYHSKLWKSASSKLYFPFSRYFVWRRYNHKCVDYKCLILLGTLSVPNYKSVWLFWFIHFAMYLDILLYLDA
jgi:hypothetical protein